MRTGPAVAATNAGRMPTSSPAGSRTAAVTSRRPAASRSRQSEFHSQVANRLPVRSPSTFHSSRSVSRSVTGCTTRVMVQPDLRAERIAAAGIPKRAEPAMNPAPHDRCIAPSTSGPQAASRSAPSRTPARVLSATSTSA